MNPCGLVLVTIHISACASSSISGHLLLLTLFYMIGPIRGNNSPKKHAWQSKIWLMEGKKYLHSPMDRFSFGVLSWVRVMTCQSTGSAFMLCNWSIKMIENWSIQLIRIMNLNPRKSIKGLIALLASYFRRREMINHLHIYRYDGNWLLVFLALVYYY